MQTVVTSVPQRIFEAINKMVEVLAIECSFSIIYPESYYYQTFSLKYLSGKIVSVFEYANFVNQMLKLNLVFTKP